MNAISVWIESNRPVLTLLYLSALGALCVTGVESYLSVPFQPGIIFVFFGFVFGIYLLNRTTDADEDLMNDSRRIVFYNAKNFYLLLALSVLGASVGFLLFRQKFHWVHALLLAFGTSYSYKILPWVAKGGDLVFFRIKEVIWLKNFSVAALWGGCVVVIPAVYSGMEPFSNSLLMLLGGGLFLSTFNNTLFDDIRDIDGDRAAEIKTLPTRYGIRFCLTLLVAADGVWAAFLGGLWMMGRLNSMHAGFLELLALFPLLYLGLHKWAPTRRTLIGTLSEADLIVFGLGLFLISR